MPDGLYERDALAWAEQQAALLRRLAAGEGVNAAVDWPNVIEEVQDVHLLKLRALPESHAAAHWRDQAGVFLDDAEDRFTPSMRHRIDLDELYAKALHLVRAATHDAGPPYSLPEMCPFTLDELLAGNLAGLAAKLNSPATPRDAEQESLP